MKLKLATLFSMATAALLFGVSFSPMNKSIQSLGDWSERRGFAITADSNDVTFIEANIDEVSAYLAEHCVGNTIDAIGKDIVIGDVMSLAFQIEGNPWTIILESHMFWERDKNGHAPSNKEISRALATTVVRCSTSDTVGTTGLTVHNDGELVSDFQGPVDPLWEDHFKNDSRYNRIEIAPFDDDPEYVEICYSFGDDSVLSETFPGAWDYVERQLIKRGIYQPGLTFSYFFDHEITNAGDSKTLTNKGIVIAYPMGDVTDVPELIRVDCYTFEKRKNPAPNP